MKQNILLIIGIIGFSAVNLQAQDRSLLVEDSVRIFDEFIISPDTLVVDSLFTHLEVKTFSPNPKKALLYAAFVPGLGQIYNRKYWKLPLVYGSAIGCIYAVSWNGTQYRGYRNAYRDLLDKDPKTDSWKAYNYRYYGGDEKEPEEWSDSARSKFGERLKNGRNNFRRNLELSYIVSVGAHLIWVIDAYVDAQLFGFDVSEDLSFRVEPVLFERTIASSRSLGLQLSITF